MEVNRPEVTGHRLLPTTGDRIVLAGRGTRHVANHELYYRAENQFGTRVLLVSLLFISTGASLLLGNLVSTFSFTFIFLHQVVGRFYKIIFSDLINRRVESDIRASILSVQNLVGRILTAMVMPFIGYYADIYSIEQTFTLIGIVGLCSGLPVIWFLKSYEII